ncbi:MULTISPECIES: LysR family transcriptional regulator [Rhizobium]|uniref:LysR family transcriptional regulator n=1 Tax=Rhizobium TaxID=379 RepID=UPI001B33A484|nr:MULTISPECIES: LysR family transcriptional regulator [Rhizobium]MBX4906057.1 LysR family transcriptional regulator [Rhizobium bangladeshense]MBX5212913.1 LysR family transcriptional regulator [Rhizobium sp. NLR9a]MBX5231378.1 LysR family transcriptional regulator [Rhizobium sp. NLR4a]MBX5243182.1 LysR family transcriptional regulator [Rhizobium sp. NLR3b]MBX5249016.1 LysR family transcriptional regulator [Rhizobium sp. NLR4b]
MPRTNLNDILIFMAVVDAGSFIAGGQAMGLSRSAAGKAVTRLEERLGARLLNRTTRTLSLTDEGRLFYEHGLQILASVDEAEASIAGQSGTPRGVLRLAVPGLFGRLVVLPLLEKYLRTWPDMQVEVNFTDRPADNVEDGFDLAIEIGATPSAADSRLIARVISSDKARLCASPSYLSERGMPRDIGDLAAHDCLFFTSRGQRQGWRFRSGGGWIKAQGRSRLRLDSGEAVRDACMAGLGIALLPHFVVAAELTAGRLRQVLSDLETDDTKIVALYPDKGMLEPRVRCFIDLLFEEIGGQG